MKVAKDQGLSQEECAAAAREVFCITLVSLFGYLVLHTW